jgi:hypothetical protein
MNASAVARQYGFLTPEERFRLILAAGARGDEAEQDRLKNSARTRMFSTSDHAPYAHAFQELALLTFIELLEDAAFYHDANEWVNDAFDTFGADDDEEEAGHDTEEEEPGADTSEDDAGERPRWQRSLELAYAAGFVLRTKVAGWKLFCERLNVPPFLLCEALPGFDRLQHALALAEESTFAPDDFLRWLNRTRKARGPELAAVPLTVEGVAGATEEMFRERVKWWGG